jgi:LysM repeat protein
MPARRRSGQWGPRLLAPAAFLVAATVAVLLIRAGMGAESGPSTTVPTVTAKRPAPQPTTTARRPQPPRRTYTIEAGDTLDQVALEHDTTVERLLELNPRIDPTSLQVGQRLVVP